MEGDAADLVTGNLRQCNECSVVSDFAGAFQVTLDLSGTNLTLTLTLPMEPGSENNSS
jgi:hypothetical protein